MADELLKEAHDSFGLDNAKNSIVRKAAILSADARSKDAETSRKALQSLLRITDIREEREKLLNSLRGVYKTLPAYQGLPSFKMAEVGRREMLKEQIASSGENEHKRMADELLFLGLYARLLPSLKRAKARLTRENPAITDTLLLFCISVVTWPIARLRLLNRYGERAGRLSN